MDYVIANKLEELENMFGSRMKQYDDKLQKVTSGSSSVHPDLVSLSKDFEEFKGFVNGSLANIKVLLDLISHALDRHETFMRRKVLLVHGLPEKPNENLQDLVHNLFNTQMKLPDIRLDNIQVCHRLGSAQDKTRPVLVRFSDILSRHAVWDSKTFLKGTGQTISEFLTKPRHRVFLAARKHFGMRQCWSTEGRITINLPDKSRRKIETMTELEVLIKQFPSSITDDDAPEMGSGPQSPKNNSGPKPPENKTSTALPAPAAPKGKTRRRN